VITSCRHSALLAALRLVVCGLLHTRASARDAAPKPTVSQAERPLSPADLYGVLVPSSLNFGLHASRCLHNFYANCLTSTTVTLTFTDDASNIPQPALV
jgi:hypothetical protein